MPLWLPVLSDTSCSHSTLWYYWLHKWVYETMLCVWLGHYSCNRWVWCVPVVFHWYRSFVLHYLACNTIRIYVREKCVSQRNVSVTWIDHTPISTNIHLGMDPTGPLNVCYDIWHQVVSKSFKFCKLQDAVFMALSSTSHRWTIGQTHGEFGSQVNSLNCHLFPRLLMHTATPGCPHDVNENRIHPTRPPCSSFDAYVTFIGALVDEHGTLTDLQVHSKPWCTVCFDSFLSQPALTIFFQ